MQKRVRPGRWPYALTALSTLASLAAGLALRTPARGEVQRRPGMDVLLVTIDTLRADAVGAYGREGGADALDRPPGRGRGPLSQCARAQRRHPALPRQHPVRAPALRARRARQRGVPLSEGNGDAGHAAFVPRLSHGRVRERLYPRIAVRARPRLRRLRRPLRRRCGGERVRAPRARRRGDGGRGPRLARRGRRPAVVRLGPSLRSARALSARRSRTRRASPAIPISATSRRRTRRSRH